MDELNQQKKDISDKLQREMDNVNLLKESLSRSDNMTQNMLSILNTFENRLSKLEETIIPIYQETGNLQRRHENIEKTLTALDNVIGFYHVAEEVDPVIRDGPSHKLSNYLECMDRLQKSVQYFTNNNPGSQEMSQVTTLYEAGKDALEREFRSLLTRHSKPVPPVIVLDVLTIEEETQEEEESTVIEQLPERTLQELSLIAKWLLNCGIDTDYMQVYSTIRSSIVVKSLHSLKDHLKSGSKELTVTHSPAVASKMKTSKDTPQTRSALSRMAFVAKTSTAIRKHMAHLETGGYAPAVDLKDDDIDIDFYIASASAFLKLIQSEAAMMQGIIPEKHLRKIFDLLIQAAFDSLTKEGELFSTYIKRAILRHDHSAVISLFPVLKHLRAIKPKFDITLEGCQAPTRTKLVTLISTLDHTGAKVLEEFVDSIKNDPDKASHMPKDGTVHELTNNTIIFLEQLLEFADTAGSMLLTQDPTSLHNVQNAERPKLKLAEFITKVLSSLGANLTNKSETYNDTTLRAVFMINNYNYILKSLKSSGMLGVVHSWNNEVELFLTDCILGQKRVYSQRTGMMRLVHLLNAKIESYYVEHVCHQRALYRKSWSRVMHYITDAERTSPHYSLPSDASKLKDKDKQLIKDKFTGFNKEMDELYRTQKAYAVPDLDLRETLKRDNRDFVLPKYRTFLRKYVGVPFTKNLDKYHRYTEKDVIGFINKFFDSAV